MTSLWKTRVAPLALAVTAIGGLLAGTALTSNAATPAYVSPALAAHQDADHAGSGLAEEGGVQELAAAPAGLRGNDVSGYQGSVNWNTVKRNGGTFAYVKATQSTGYKNPSFGNQYAGAHNAGLIRGAYHFAIPNTSSGKAQADFFVKNGGGFTKGTKTLPGALDIEYNPNTKSDHTNSCYGLSKPAMVTWITAFTNEYHAKTGAWPVLYTTTDWWRTCTGNSNKFGHDPLWIAKYTTSAGTLPAGWSNYTFHQYADHGTLPGDQNVFNGNAAKLLALTK